MAFLSGKYRTICARFDGVGGVPIWILSIQPIGAQYLRFN